MSRTDGAIATTRFGLGAARGEIAAASSDPRGWLLQQLDMRRVDILDERSLPSSKAATIAVFESLQKLRAAKKAAKQDGTKKVMREMRGHLRIYANEVVARSRHAMQTESSFHERLVRFWSNHFTVSGTKQLLMGLVGPFEREAIRPHVLGTFRDMLQAVEHHPGMLIYLDNIGSIGPNSRVGKRRGRGLNENLAREILELHTLGVDGGYTQADIE